jgi:hypothetical protein
MPDKKLSGSEWVFKELFWSSSTVPVPDLINAVNGKLGDRSRPEHPGNEPHLTRSWWGPWARWTFRHSAGTWTKFAAPLLKYNGIAVVIADATDTGNQCCRSGQFLTGSDFRKRLDPDPVPDPDLYINFRTTYFRKTYFRKTYFRPTYFRKTYFRPTYFRQTFFGIFLWKYALKSTVSSWTKKLNIKARIRIRIRSLTSGSRFDQKRSGSDRIRIRNTAGNDWAQHRLPVPEF